MELIRILLIILQLECVKLSKGHFMPDFELMDAEEVLTIVDRLNELYYPHKECSISFQDIVPLREDPYNNTVDIIEQIKP